MTNRNIDIILPTVNTFKKAETLVKEIKGLWLRDDEKSVTFDGVGFGLYRVKVTAPSNQAVQVVTDLTFWKFI